ncbi:carbohydrate kinase [Phycicoccus endophyticus]|uniref:Carbohydrate kinase n=1 Tax=Phycicoccus endophyticus TaxID=1690220 RepID=A0A7G9QZ36_9MICO|nr:carbohydrate kinase [Phycicoccus endophyticus]NHI18955.1 carbohydrate kinase [Phycicoccus endophyticus]QNN48611.1 carbohydrate kinase [Phycicoccus endophyticus]GGL31659.1 ribokinase [Phycicoccus endophyticus]
MSVTAPPVVVVGELLVDIVHHPDGSSAEHVGGSPANVAMGLARLGHDTHLACLVGDDERGRMCARHVESTGVHLLPGSRSPEHPTSTAIATLDDSGAATYDFDLHWDLPPVQLPSGTGHLHTGSIGTTLEPGEAEVTAAVHRARAGGTVSYDPNARPTIMGEVETVRPRVEELVGLADVVKCSEDDLAWLYPDEAPSAVMARWAALGASLVVVTLGGDGVAWRTASGEDDREPARVRDVVDTVGAGDSFMAGLLSGLLDAGLLGSTDARGRLAAATLADVRPAVERALATSGLTVRHAGAYAPTREELP